MPKPKIRKYNVVFHNVDNEKAQATLQAYVDKNAKEYLMSVEPYPTQTTAHHAHLTIEYKTQRYFTPVLKELQRTIKSAIAIRPEGCVGDWGRVHLEPTRGTMDENLAYLQGKTKDKPLGEVKSGKKYPHSIIQRMIALAYYQTYITGINDRSQMMDEFDEEYGNRFCEACFNRFEDYIEERENPE